MHSNVGGGYPDDGMSYKPLIWILVNAQDAGLEVEPTLMAQYQAYASAFGRMYDSRANVSSYYRYSPRMISANPSPRIDNSVYQRIRGGGNQYAPIPVPPQGYARQYHDLVWDTVWWRRVAYWVMAILSGTLVALPWLPLKWRRADAYTMDFVDALTGWLQATWELHLTGAGQDHRTTGRRLAERADWLPQPRFGGLFYVKKLV